MVAVTVEVQQAFAATSTRVPDKLSGESPTTVTFAAGHATASLSLPTVNDALADYDVVVTVAIGAGAHYSAVKGGAKLDHRGGGKLDH